MKNAFVKLKYKFGVMVQQEMPIKDVSLFLAVAIAVLPEGIIGNICVKLL